MEPGKPSRGRCAAQGAAATLAAAALAAAPSGLIHRVRLAVLEEEVVESAGFLGVAKRSASRYTFETTSLRPLRASRLACLDAEPWRHGASSTVRFGAVVQQSDRTDDDDNLRSR